MLSEGSADLVCMPPPQVAKTLARVLGALLIVLALVGFIPNPLILNPAVERVQQSNGACP